MLPSTEYQKRIRHFQSLLRARSKKGIAIISTAPPSIRNRDVHYPFRQESNFLYLTGSVLEEASLVIFADSQKSILVTPPFSPLKKLWEGEVEKSQSVARRIKATLLETQNPIEELVKLSRGHELLCFGNRQGSSSYEVAMKLAAIPSHKADNLPSHFTVLDPVIEPMRIKKSAAEIKVIQKALRVSEESLYEILPLIKPRSSEMAIAASLEGAIKARGATLAFSSIVASGASASTLHYSAHTRALRADELLLIDFGAEVDGYAADITRMFPVSGKFTGKLRELYQIVLEAQKAAIAAVRPKRKVADVYGAATSIIVDGLKDLKLLKGGKSSIIKKKEFTRYFPHSIGHTLGLDVHDIGSMRASGDTQLETGMVITIEPGIYLSKAQAGLPSCGIRIEDDVQVTPKGSRTLSSSIPKEIDDIEALLQV